MANIIKITSDDLCYQSTFHHRLDLGADVIPCYKVVKNLGLLINQNLTWDNQVNKICRNASYTLKRLRSNTSHQLKQEGNE
jgi:hypothetical protein